MKTIEEIEELIDEAKDKNMAVILMPCSEKRDAVMIANYFRKKGYECEVSDEINKHWCVDIRL